jgi:hypothetical protein
MYISFEGNLFFKRKVREKTLQERKVAGGGGATSLSNVVQDEYHEIPFLRDSKRGLEYFCRKNVIWMVEILVQGTWKAIDEQEQTMFTVVRIIGV